MNDEVRIIHNITKEFPEMIQITIFKEPKILIKKDIIKRKREEVNLIDYIPKYSSIQRTRSLIHDLVLCNDFELFCTFTFDPKRVRSESLMASWSVMQRWLSHQRDLSRSKGKQLKYLIIPEQHKSGRWHFHALISGYSSTLRYSGHKSSSDRPIYNITAFRSGFTTAVAVDSKAGVASYITKYITKDLVKFYNQRRFFASNNLVRPVRTTNSKIFTRTLPVFRQHVSSTDLVDTYVIDKTCMV